MPLNHISREVVNRIPLNGVDTHIVCSGCDALCCREGKVMPLSGDEIAFMEEAGTKLVVYPMSGRSLARRVLDLAMLRHEKAEQSLMQLTTDCGHLTTDEETGRLICGAYNDERRPQICSDFKTGGYRCGLTQLSRLPQVLQCDDSEPAAASQVKPNA
jgi:hypothetical protein